MDSAGVEPASLDDLKKDIYTLVPFFIRPTGPKRTWFPIDFSTYFLGRKQVDRFGPAGFSDGLFGRFPLAPEVRGCPFYQAAMA
jgi:hypothetical protein